MCADARVQTAVRATVCPDHSRSQRAEAPVRTCAHARRRACGRVRAGMRVGMRAVMRKDVDAHTWAGACADMRRRDTAVGLTCWFKHDMITKVVCGMVTNML